MEASSLGTTSFHRRTITDRPTRVTDQVAKLIQDWICRGAFKPGERLVEMTLARQFGVGQNVVREALIELEHHGYVQRFPRRGTYVISLDENDVAKLYEVRTPWESLAIELLLGRWKDEEPDLTPAEQALAGMYQAVEQADFQTLTERDWEFHRALWSLAGNEYLSQALERVCAPLFAATTIQELTTAQSKARHKRSVSHHAELLEAVKARSLEDAREALRIQGEESIRNFPCSRKPRE